ncbi:MAG: DUF6265 family protein [Ignavibacteria bacterium]
MFNTKSAGFVLILMLVFSINEFAQENGKKESAGNLISKISWLAGSYRGEKWESISEEHWSLPIGDNMIGMFRLIKEDKIVFTELVYIIEENNTLTLRLKHFSKEFIGWEEKDKTVDFPLVRIGDKEVIFEGLTYKKSDDGKLIGTVKIKDKKTGEIKEEEFLYDPI